MGLRRHILRPALRQFHRLRSYGAPEYHGPDATQMDAIATGFQNLDIPVQALRVPPDSFREFQKRLRFPPDYHGGVNGGVYEEKLLEHYLAYELNGLAKFESADIYVDVAACTSPWARMLRESGIQAWAIDLQVSPSFAELDYYQQQDATRTSFASASVRGMSLQCAFEMFCGDDDWRFIDECARILAPGGICVISPLYMHTHYCGYSTPEYFGRGHADPGAREYIRHGFTGVPFSRKYDPATLASRILKRADAAGLQHTLYRLVEQETLGKGIYCEFVLRLDKPAHN